MRIALLAPLVSPIAPPYLGGAQALLADLASGLARRGHSVTLYAADGSAVPGVEVPQLGIDSTRLATAHLGGSVAPASPNNPNNPNGPIEDRLDPEDDDRAADEYEKEEDGDPWESAWLSPDQQLYLSDYAFLRAYRAIAEHADRYDLVHAHAYDVPAYAYSSTQPLPVLHTLHLPPLDESIRAILEVVAPPESAPSTRLVTVSAACAATYMPFCRIDAVIYNGIPVERIPFSAEPEADGYLLYAGRISPEKGVEDALEIARRAGKRLMLAGGIYDRGYYDRRVAPRLRERATDTTYLGSLAREQLWHYMAGAQALLVPSHWDEPFGLVAAEAQASGTPVIGYARGGLPEVVADGVTGWLTAPGDLEGAADAVGKVGRLSRGACRRWVAERFTLDGMLDTYLAFYSGMLGR